MSDGDQFQSLVPTGTEIVTRAVAGEHPVGSVGVITASPADNTHSYQIHLVDGAEISLRREEFAILKHFQRHGIDEPGAVLAEYDLYDCVIYRCVVGSRAYGLDGDESDIDRRGIYLPPADLQWSLYGVPEQLENKETDEAYWELRKFLILALKANPNILECLHTPIVEMVTPLAQELLDMREAFLSKLVYQTYNGYVISQFKKLEQDLRTRGEIRWKHAMHLIRLLLSGITALRERYVPVSVEEHRDRLLAIRRGEVPWEEIDAWRLELHKEFDAAYEKTSLPERPDYAGANEFLIKARKMRAFENGCDGHG
ncbi:MAG: nucleotidyltransferase domain-containing protein [Armatimonadota bacterium]|nr:nucleotidyltransferase domain-containing protein [bacterium]